MNNLHLNQLPFHFCLIDYTVSTDRELANIDRKPAENDSRWNNEAQREQEWIQLHIGCIDFVIAIGVGRSDCSTEIAIVAELVIAVVVVKIDSQLAQQHNKDR